MTALGVIQALYSWRVPLDIPGLLTPKAIIHGIESVSWRGRLSWHTYKGHQVLVDGAHNPASSQALSQYLAGIYPRKAKKIQVTFVLALSHSPPKQPQDTLEPFLSLSTPPPQLTLSAAFVPFTPPTDMPWVKFVPPWELAKVAEDILQPRGSIWTPESNRPLEEGAPNTYLESALEWAVAQGEGAEHLIVVAGSLYLVADFYRLNDPEIGG
jgi:folylpolyglutamate synthase